RRFSDRGRSAAPLGRTAIDASWCESAGRSRRTLCSQTLYQLGSLLSLIAKGQGRSVQCCPIDLCLLYGGSHERAMPDISGASWWRCRLRGRGLVDGRRTPASLCDRCEAFNGRGAEGFGVWTGADGEGEYPGGRQEGSSASLHGHACGRRSRERFLRSQRYSSNQTLPT